MDYKIVGIEVKGEGEGEGEVISGEAYLFVFVYVCGICCNVREFQAEAT